MVGFKKSDFSKFYHKSQKKASPKNSNHFLKIAFPSLTGRADLGKTLKPIDRGKRKGNVRRGRRTKEKGWRKARKENQQKPFVP